MTQPSREVHTCRRVVEQLDPSDRIDAVPCVDLAPRRGRPRQAETLFSMNVRIPVSLYDEYCRASIATRVPASVLMREALTGFTPSLLRRRRGR